MIQHTPVNKKLVCVPLKPCRLALLLLTDLHRHGVDHKAVFQTILQKQAVLPVAVLRTAPEQKGKRNVRCVQLCASYSKRIGRVTPRIPQMDSVIFLRIIGRARFPHTEIKQQEVCLRMFLEGVQNPLLISLVIYNILVGEQDNITLRTHQRIISA